MPELLKAITRAGRQGLAPQIRFLALSDNWPETAFWEATGRFRLDCRPTGSCPATVSRERKVGVSSHY